MSNKNCQGIMRFSRLFKSEIKPENGGIKPYTSRGPSGCIWLNTSVRGVYLTYFLILFMKYSLYKGGLSQDNNWPLGQKGSSVKQWLLTHKGNSNFPNSSLNNVYMKIWIFGGTELRSNLSLGEEQNCKWHDKTNNIRVGGKRNLSARLTSCSNIRIAVVNL